MPALRVLVADDQVLNQKIAARWLRELGHGGVLVPDGAQALKALQTQSFDLVLMDVSMPVLNGLDALEAWRAWETSRGLKRLPVIIVSAYDTPSDREHFQRVGADGFIAKPMRLEPLQQEIERLFGRGGRAPPGARTSP